MRSVGQRGATVVTIVTLVFAPVAKGKHWVWRLFSSSSTVTTVACADNQPCPAQQKIVDKIYLPPTDLR